MRIELQGWKFKTNQLVFSNTLMRTANQTVLYFILATLSFCLGDSGYILSAPIIPADPEWHPDNVLTQLAEACRKVNAVPAILHDAECLYDVVEFLTRHKTFSVYVAGHEPHPELFVLDWDGDILMSYGNEVWRQPLPVLCEMAK